MANVLLMDSTVTLWPQYLSWRFTWPVTRSNPCMPQTRKPRIADVDCAAFAAMCVRFCVLWRAER
eukprot:2882909-Pyramimonas_sp.AAC.1